MKRLIVLIFFTFVASGLYLVRGQQVDADLPTTAQLINAAERGDAKAQFNIAKAYVDKGLTPVTEQVAAKWLRKLVIDQHDELMFPAILLLGKIRQSMRQEYPKFSKIIKNDPRRSIGIAIANSGDRNTGIDVAMNSRSRLVAIWLLLKNKDLTVSS
ncbi:MAG: hypothetical protein HN705_17665 [Rhodospirillales bacterium]|nr:hypothetical protein [Rhodospirillales bacterium]